MTKFDSMNFAKMFTLPFNAQRENFAFFDNTWLQSNLKSPKSSKLPIYDKLSSLLCLVNVFFTIFEDRVFTSLFFLLQDIYILEEMKLSV